LSSSYLIKYLDSKKKKISAAAQHVFLILMVLVYLDYLLQLEFMCQLIIIKFHPLQVNEDVLIHLLIEVVDWDL
jgi:hypothetical protein